MRILFIFPREKEYNSLTVREHPSGGTEKAVIFLGEAMAKLGHTVEWMTVQGQEVDANPDVVISQHAEYFQYFPQARCIWWAHHFPDQPIIKQQAVWARCFAAATVTLSHCQTQQFKDELRIDAQEIGHGVWPDDIVRAQKVQGSFIYASTPFRGLDQLPELIRSIQAVNSFASFKICSSLGVYGDASGDSEYKALFDELDALPRVIRYPALNQRELYTLYAQSQFFLYPCTWPETYCLALDEAMAHGCLPWVPDVGALPERTMWTDFKLPSPCFFSDKVKAGDGRVLSGYGIQPRSWDEVAQDWERVIQC